MAKIPQLMELIAEGWPAHRIRQKLKLKPYRLAQMLSSRTFRNMPANHRQLTQIAGQYKACQELVEAVSRLEELLHSPQAGGETARRAAGQLIRLAGGQFPPAQAPLPEADPADNFSAPPPPTADAKLPRQGKRWREASRSSGEVSRASCPRAGETPATHCHANRRQTRGKRRERVAKRSKTVENESEFFRTFPQFSAENEGFADDNPCIQQVLVQNQAIERAPQSTICQISEPLMPPGHGSLALPGGGQAARRSHVDNSSSPLIMG